MDHDSNMLLPKACGIAVKALKFLRLGTILLRQELFEILIIEGLTTESGD